MSFRTKRIYEKAGTADGYRVLVDRLWPRGVAKASARVDLWLRDVAPSDALRKWFAHDPARWDEFKGRYFRELDRHPERLQELRARGRGRRVTLLFAARNAEQNNAVALKEYLERRR